MIYIDKNPNPSGAYPNAKCQPFADCIPLTDEQAKVFFAYNGFVIVQDGEVVPNVEAWEAWKANLPDPEPEPEPEEPTSVWDELDAAYQEGVNGAYDE